MTHCPTWQHEFDVIIYQLEFYRGEEMTIEYEYSGFFLDAFITGIKRFPHISYTSRQTWYAWKQTPT